MEKIKKDRYLQFVYKNNKDFQNKNAGCFCGWRGKISQCDIKEYNNISFLSGDAGLEFICPKCKDIVVDKLVICLS